MSAVDVSRPAVAGGDKAKTRYTYTALRDQILHNKLLPGTPLVERRLCDQLKVSRTPVREALQRLAHEELVTLIPGKLAHVSYITYESIVEVYDVREVLEGLAVRLFVENADQERVEALAKTLQEFRSAAAREDFDAATEADMDFHKSIVRNSKNAKLAKMVSAVSVQVKRLTILTKYVPLRAQSTYDQHLAVLQAVQQGNAALAERKMRDHIRDSKKYHISNINRYKFDQLSQGE